MKLVALPSVSTNRVSRGMGLLARLAAPAAAVFLAAGAAATEATWTNVADETAGWYVAANWVDAGGTPLSVAPTNGEDVTFAAITSHPLYQRISTGKTSGHGSDPTTRYLTPSTAVDVTVGKLAGPADRTIRVAEETGGNQSQLIRLFSVADPNGFLGFWEPGDGKVNLELRATGTFVPVMANVSASKRPFVTVPNNGTTAEIARVHQTGAIQKKGAGSLVVRETAGEETRFYVDEGEVVFAMGDAPVNLTALLAEAILNLDASAADTLTSYVDPEDGRTCITNWADAAGRSLYARCPLEYGSTAQYYLPYVRPPFLCVDTSPTGLPLVDFGSLRYLDGTSLGPTNCAMVLSQERNVREAFYFIDAPAGYVARTVICGTEDYSFMSEGAYIFCEYSGTGGKVYNGDIRVNGERIRNRDRLAQDLVGMFTLSVGTTADAPIKQIGTRQFYASHTGGMRIGEIILFERVLTHAERAAVNAYLRKKWLTGEDPADATDVFLASGTRLGVAAGKKARVRRVAADAALVKMGAGELELGSVQPASTPVELRGGALKIKGCAFPEEIDSPAPGAYVWLDATRDDTFTTSNHVGDGKVYIEEWRDCRAGTDVKATCIHKTPGMPFKADGPGVGKQVVDFGRRLTYTTCGTQSSMKLPKWSTGSRDTFAGFCVLRQTDPSTATAPAFGHSNMDMYRSASQLAASDYVNGFCSSAAWTIDGKAVNPWLYQSRLQQTNHFVVVAFTSRRPLVVDGLAQDRAGDNIYTNYCGNIQIGEYILYHRPLSDGERIRTEAYLMNKWLGKTHPEAASTAKLEKVSILADGTSLGSDIPLEVERFVGVIPGDGTFTKTGPGTLTIQAFEAENLRSLTVQDGTLSFTPSDITGKAAFHFDASDADSFTTFLTDNGATTNVLNWADTRGSGLTTYCPISTYAPGQKNGQLIFTHPVLRTFEMRPGIFRPALDFGTYSGYYTNNQNAGSSGLSFSYNGTTANARFTNIREAFSVFSDRSSTSRNFIFCDSTAYHYHRNGAEILAGMTDEYGPRAGGTVDGYHAVDGVEVPYNYSLPSGFHVINFAPTNNTAISRFAYDRTSNGGASYIAEAIGFSNVLSVARRKFIELQLMHKWFDTPAPVWTNTLDEVTVADGASLVLGGTDALAVSRISGSGSITASAVTGLSELSFTSDASGQFSPLSLNGELSFAPAVSVEVVFAGAGEPAFGDHPLLVAANLGETDVRAWTLTTNFSSAYSASLIRQNNTVLLRIIPKGTVIFLR